MPNIYNLVADNIHLWTSSIESKSGVGRGSKGKLSLHGIQKLRELILELAVRGKLISQDLNDEPASKLIKHIKPEKHKANALDTIASNIEEDLYKLPVGWLWVRFGSIAHHNSGKTLDKGRNTGALRPYITTSNLYWGKFILDGLREMPIEEVELERCVARKGDLLICEGGEAGRAAVWDSEEEVCFQNHIHRARMLGNINPYYLYRFFQKLDATGEINKYRKGVAISNMSSKSLASISVPLPPIAEQARIVAKIDELMALCDLLEKQTEDSIAAHQTLVEVLLETLTQSHNSDELFQNWARVSEYFDVLFATEQSIEQLKQTILHLGVIGKLVPQDPSDETAAVLIKKVAIEKERLIEEGRIKKQKMLPPINNSEKPFLLPKGWVWARLNDYFDIRDGTHDSPKAQLSGYPLVTSKNLSSGKLDISNITYISEADHRKIQDRSKVDFGDILFAMIGSIGNPVIVDIEDEFSIKNVALFKYYKLDLSVPRYLLYFLEVASKKMRSEASGGVQSFVSLGNLRSFPIAVPPLNEQHRIVSKIDELMKLCDQIKESLSEAQRTQNNLADTIVKKAVA